MIEIKEVSTNKELSTFIKVPDTLFKANKYYVPRLHFDEKNVLSKDKNPAFKFCESRYWIAYKDGKPVGRIAAIINHRHLEKSEKKLIRFGWFDFPNDEAVARKLVETVEKWAKEKGLNQIHGPLGFTDLDPEGMMVSGFEETGNMATIFNEAYYPEIMEKIGFQKDAEWVQYRIEIPDAVPEKVAKVSQMVQQRYKIRPLVAKSAKELLPYGKQIFQVINEAFDHLYGTTELSDEQIENYIKAYFGFIKPEFVGLVLNEENEVVGAGISFPCLSPALQKAKGSLFPFGVFHLLKALYLKNEKVDMYLIGVKKEYRSKGAMAVVFDYLAQQYIKAGCKFAETGPQLENNPHVLNLWHDMNFKPFMRRRCYLKEIV